MIKTRFFPVLGISLLGFLAGGCSDNTISQEVTATAYTLSEAETKKGNVGLAAWGDQLEPGMKAIAVSRDLLAAGLDYGTAVKIEGLEGTWYVRDKMHARWRNKIDVYLGEDREAALRWGRRKVEIRY